MNIFALGIIMIIMLLLLVLACAVIIRLTERVKRLEKDVTELVRKEAIENAKSA